MKTLLKNVIAAAKEPINGTTSMQKCLTYSNTDVHI